MSHVARVSRVRGGREESDRSNVTFIFGGLPVRQVLDLRVHYPFLRAGSWHAAVKATLFQGVSRLISMVFSQRSQHAFFRSSRNTLISSLATSAVSVPVWFSCAV